jgi:hypothetical protein
MRLLFTLAHWHGLAKMRLHTDETLKILDTLTMLLGSQLREFRKTTCAAYETFESPREANSRQRRGKAASSGKKSKAFNLNTFKIHSLGDYVETIRRYGTTDSYSTEPVSQMLLPTSSTNSALREN